MKLLSAAIFVLFLGLTTGLFAQEEVIKDTALYKQFDRLTKAYEAELWKNIDAENWDEARVDIMFLDGLYDCKLTRIAWYMKNASKDYVFTDKEMHLLVWAKKRLQELGMERNKVRQ
jgi:hypothetical protein